MTFQQMIDKAVEYRRSSGDPTIEAKDLMDREVHIYIDGEDKEIGTVHVLGWTDYIQFIIDRRVSVRRTKIDNRFLETEKK